MTLIEMKSTKKRQHCGKSVMIDTLNGLYRAANPDVDSNVIRSFITQFTDTENHGNPSKSVIISKENHEKEIMMVVQVLRSSPPLGTPPLFGYQFMAQHVIAVLSWFGVCYQSEPTVAELVCVRLFIREHLYTYMLEMTKNVHKLYLHINIFIYFTRDTCICMYIHIHPYAYTYT
jgi:hypothetical protein